MTGQWERASEAVPERHLKFFVMEMVVSTPELSMVEMARGADTIAPEE
jgi:hypothetical protein